MPVQSLVQKQKQTKQTYSIQKLFSLVFTDYTGIISELQKNINIETYAKTQIAQIVNQTGVIPVAVIVDFFATLNEINQQAALNAAITEQQIQGIIDAAGQIPIDTGTTSYGAGG